MAVALAGSLLAIESDPFWFPAEAPLNRAMIVSCPPGATTNDLLMVRTLKLGERLLTLVTFKIAGPVLRIVSRRSTVVFAGTTPKSIAGATSIAGRLAPLKPALARIVALADVPFGGGLIGPNCAPLSSDAKLRFCAALLESIGKPTPSFGVGATKPT